MLTRAFENNHPTGLTIVICPRPVMTLVSAEPCRLVGIVLHGTAKRLLVAPEISPVKAEACAGAFNAQELRGMAWGTEKLQIGFHTFCTEKNKLDFPILPLNRNVQQAAPWLFICLGFVATLTTLLFRCCQEVSHFHFNPSKFTGTDLKCSAPLRTGCICQRAWLPCSKSCRFTAQSQ